LVPGEVEALSATVLPSTGRAYRLARVCRVRSVARATIYRRRRPVVARPKSRPGPTGQMSDAELVAAIHALLAKSAFHG
jgi:hypothetical protein